MRVRLREALGSSICTSGRLLSVHHPGQRVVNAGFASALGIPNQPVELNDRGF